MNHYSMVGIRQDELPKIIGRMEAEEIIKVVANYYGLNRKELNLKCRKKTITQARFMAAYFLRCYTSLYLQQIANCFGDGMADHTSAIYAIKTVQNQIKLKHDNPTKKQVEDIRGTFLLTVKTA